MKTLLIVSEVQLIYKTKIPNSERPKIGKAQDAFDLFWEYWDKDTIEHIEQFKLLLLNRSNKVLGIVNISSGGLNGTVTDIRLILQYAIKSNASGLIVCHNHPSGNLNASDADRKITSKIKEAGNILDINLLDHLIIIPEGKFFSFADDGLI